MASLNSKLIMLLWRLFVSTPINLFGGFRENIFFRKTNSILETKLKDLSFGHPSLFAINSTSMREDIKTKIRNKKS